MQKMIKKVTRKHTIISHGSRIPGANHLREDKRLGKRLRGGGMWEIDAKAKGRVYRERFDDACRIIGKN